MSSFATFDICYPAQERQANSKLAGAAPFSLCGPDVLKEAGQPGLSYDFACVKFSTSPRCVGCATADHPVCLDCLPMMN